MSVDVYCRYDSRPLYRCILRRAGRRVSHWVINVTTRRPPDGPSEPTAPYRPVAPCVWRSHPQGWHHGLHGLEAGVVSLSLYLTVHIAYFVTSWSIPTPRTQPLALGGPTPLAAPRPPIRGALGLVCYPGASTNRSRLLSQAVYYSGGRTGVWRLRVQLPVHVQQKQAGLLCVYAHYL